MEKNYTRRKQRGSETLRKLKDSAIRLINERGYEQVTVEDICADCGLSKGAFYHHFKAKVELVSALEADVNTKLTQVLEEMKDRDILDKLLVLNGILIGSAADNGFELARERCIYNLQGQYTKDADSESYAVRSREIVRQLLVEAVEKRQLSAELPVEELVELISVFGSGILSNWCVYNGSFPVKDKSNRLFSLMISGVLAQYRNP